jgi:AcrR family transcriptional regulator
MNAIADDLITAAIDAAEAAGKPVADVSLDAIARQAGISRATLFRRIGTRAALDAAVRASGVDLGGRPDVRSRATAAAADLIEEAGLAAMTLEAVAARAECSVQALHSQLGGREGLLQATLERFTPLPRVEAAFTGAPPDLETGTRLVYGIVFDTVEARRALLIALIAEAATRPESPSARYLLENYLPRAFGTIGVWLQKQIEAGTVRPLPRPVLLQLFAAPIGFHAISRPLIGPATGAPPPDRDEVIDQLTQAFIRAVSPA